MGNCSQTGKSGRYFRFEIVRQQDRKPLLRKGLESPSRKWRFSVFEANDIFQRFTINYQALKMMFVEFG